MRSKEYFFDLIMFSLVVNVPTQHNYLLRDISSSYETLNCSESKVKSVLQCASLASASKVVTFYFNSEDSFCFWECILLFNSSSFSRTWRRYEKEWERNAAIHQPTTASSIYGDESNKWGSYYATDGLKSTDISSGGYFHSNVQSTPWLSVDLQEALRISFLRVFNRRDTKGERFHDVAVEVSLGGNPYEQKGFFKGPGVTNQVVEILCDHPTVGRYVRIKIISGVGNYLHINEIEIYTIS